MDRTLLRHWWGRLTRCPCYCTLAIHPPYRERARKLFGALRAPLAVVLTDEPADFSGCGVSAFALEPSGPMAKDYLEKLPPTGEEWGAAAYHDKRFALAAALKVSQTAIYLDADTRVNGPLPRVEFPKGLSVLPTIRSTVAKHLEHYGTWREPHFRELCRQLTGKEDVFFSAPWCQENLMVIRADGREHEFFKIWGIAASFLQARGVFSGEGGVIGLAAFLSGWDVNFDAAGPLSQQIEHEAGGPKIDCRGNAI